MAVNKELNELKEQDIYSILLFALYKLRNIPEYSALSELSFVLDKNNLLNLCEYFGGCTITIPTIDEIESVTDALLLYQYIDVQKMSEEEALTKISRKSYDIFKVKNIYKKIRIILMNYQFKSRK